MLRTGHPHQQRRSLTASNTSIPGRPQHESRHTQVCRARVEVQIFKHKCEIFKKKKKTTHRRYLTFQWLEVDVGDAPFVTRTVSFVSVPRDSAPQIVQGQE